jgi:hypothetical protein
MRNAKTVTAALATAGAAMLLATSAEARPIFIKYDDIKGESAASADGGHKDWIELTSVSIAPAARGGVRVAAGDVNGAAARAGSAGAPRALAAPNPVPVGLLLPAVQKVREAAARIPAGAACTVGPVRGPVAVMESESGATGRILDAAVTGCSAESVSVNFTKIEWD